MPRLQVRRDQQYELRVAVIRRRTIRTLPDRVTESRTRRADVRMRVVTIDAPRLKYAIDESLVPRTTDVVDDLIASIFL